MWLQERRYYLLSGNQRKNLHLVATIFVKLALNEDIINNSTKILLVKLSYNWPSSLKFSLTEIKCEVSLKSWLKFNIKIFTCYIITLPVNFSNLILLWTTTRLTQILQAASMHRLLEYRYSFSKTSMAALGNYWFWLTKKSLKYG